MEVLQETIRRAAVGVTRMTLADALALGPAAWDSLLEQGGAPSPFMSWAWYRAWADSAPAADVAASEVLTLANGAGSIQALLPIRLRRTSFHRFPVAALTWADGDTGCPDLLDALAVPGADLSALVPVLAGLPWHVAVFSNLVPDAVGVRRLCDAFGAQGYALRRRELWPCPYLDLSDDWEGYLATLTPTRRQTLRRKERNLRRDHAMTITDYDGPRVEEGLAKLMALHRSRWERSGEGDGAFRDARVVHLHQRFAALLAARDQLWLTTLDLDGQPAAAWYGFTLRDAVYFYQSGRDPRWDRESVGLVLMGAMIQRAMERGFRRFDFLRGDDVYKRQWTDARRFTEEITIFRPGWRGRGLRALDAAADLRARLRG